MKQIYFNNQLKVKRLNANICYDEGIFLIGKNDFIFHL